MSFSGDLEHLPIVDVIQLLHSTRKSGTLCLKGQKGESQLVFSDGYFTSANHLNNSIRIGQLLVDMGAITQDDLEATLQEQKNAGSERKPLIATLIEIGRINKEDAYKGLESLIEMTIVEVLTWTCGTFSLDVTKTEVSDEYRYFPEKLHEEICMNAQSILMDALRIYDEKMRDGTLADVFFTADDSMQNSSAEVGNADAITADLLGLDALETMEKKIPSVFIGLKDHDPADEHRKVVESEFKDFSADEREKLCSYLIKLTRQAVPDKESVAGLAAIVFSHDNFIKHTVTEICRHVGLFVFTTDDAENIDIIIEQSLSKDLLPVLILDTAGGSSHEIALESVQELIQEKREKYPRISILQIIPSSLDYTISLQLLGTGSRAVFPRPVYGIENPGFVSGMISFLQSLHSYLQTSYSTPEQHAIHQLKERCAELSTYRELPVMALALLNYASVMFERVITFVVGKQELIAEKGIGIKSDRENGPSAPMMFRIPLDQPSVLRDTIEKQRIFYSLSNDKVLTTKLFKEIGAPRISKILLMPLVYAGKTIAIIYGDFGAKAVSPAQIDLLDILARHAGLALDNSLYRKKFEKLTHTT